MLDETLITRLEAIDIEAINVMICSVLESNVCSEKQRRVRNKEPDKHVHRKKDLIHGWNAKQRRQPRSSRRKRISPASHE